VGVPGTFVFFGGRGVGRGTADRSLTLFIYFFYFVGAGSLGDWDHFFFFGEGGPVFWFTSMGGGPV
jgi:hypothetical protein